jgi:hypothetical protein
MPFNVDSMRSMVLGIYLGEIRGLNVETIICLQWVSASLIMICLLIAHSHVLCLYGCDTMTLLAYVDAQLYLGTCLAPSTN